MEGPTGQRPLQEQLSAMIVGFTPQKPYVRVERRWVGKLPIEKFSLSQHM